MQLEKLWQLLGPLGYLLDAAGEAVAAVLGRQSPSCLRQRRATSLLGPICYLLDAPGEAVAAVLGR